MRFGQIEALCPMPQQMLQIILGHLLALWPIIPQNMQGNCSLHSDILCPFYLHLQQNFSNGSKKFLRSIWKYLMDLFAVFRSELETGLACLGCAGRSE